MKILLRMLLVLSVSLAVSLRLSAENDDPKLPPEEIEKLVSPISLYPDSLVALILPAATESADVVRAARFLAGGGQQSDIEKQFWHESVKSLAHYPDIVKWMDQNLEWTQQIGGAFAEQPADVMAAIQRQRAHARAAGLLTDTPQQRVVVEQELIYITPVDARMIYIPRYDPDVLWMRRPYEGAFISFGIGFSIGDWLFYDCDWMGRTIWVHRRHPGWAYHPGWRPPPPAVRVNVVKEWHPRYNHRSSPVWHHQQAPVVVPRPFGFHQADDPRHHDSRHHQRVDRVPEAPRHREPERPVSPPEVAPRHAPRGMTQPSPHTGGVMRATPPPSNLPPPANITRPAVPEPPRHNAGSTPSSLGVFSKRPNQGSPLTSPPSTPAAQGTPKSSPSSGGSTFSPPASNQQPSRGNSRAAREAPPPASSDREKRVYDDDQSGGGVRRRGR